jgi:hypothetical protein
MDFAEAAIRSVNWRCFRISTGEATQFGAVLTRLIHSRDAAESKDTWRYIENSVFSQDMIYSAAEPTIDVMLAALVEERPLHVKALIVDLTQILDQARALDSDIVATANPADPANEGSFFLRELNYLYGSGG